jgi:DNA (cytosine-5)-methyltransferase 1
MRFGSVCSGIEAASVAWHPLGWRAAWLSEIEPFPSAVLAHHYPDVPNLGDMTLLPERILSGEVEAPDVFCGGTPCQAFSVAGLRKSLEDARGNLSLTFVGIANAIDHVRSIRSTPPAIVFWENVPGVLSTKDNAFGCFLGALAGEDDPLIPSREKWTNAGCVYGPQRTVAWRVLDAQYFGVAQRRRRVFVVASARDGFDPAAVLFEFGGVRRDTAPSREAGQGFTPGATSSPSSSSWWDGGDVDATLTTKSDDQRMPDKANAQLVMQPIAFHPTQDPISSKDGSTHAMGTGNGQGCATVAVMQPIPIDTMNHIGRGDNHSMGDFVPGAPSFTLTKGHSHAVATPMDFDLAQITSAANRSRVSPELPASTITKGSDMHVANTMAVRRLTPVECERLQGFPDQYTAISWRKKPVDECPDGPRYKALGNSWAVPNVRWIGQRIQNEIEKSKKQNK